MEHFNIELNNPMTILQQEEAKNFFKENDDKKMYQFFQRGSMLESIDVTNKKTMHQIGLMHESLQVKNVYFRSFPFFTLPAINHFVN